MQEAGVPLPSITVVVSTKKDTGVAQVTIQDNGPGIKEHDLRRLFEPFFTTKPAGIGMGLSVSRSLIEANGGQLWIDPQERPGATFHFTLPLAT
jgi:two-component system sensor kinase FixL